jgi:membrane fusion protein, multidrug efflux system
MRQKRWLLLLIGCVLVGGAWFYFNYSKSSNVQETGSAGGAKKGGRGGPAGAVPVVAGTVQKRDVPIYLDGIGTVQAYNMVTVHPQISGTLMTVAFKEGQDVKQGDLLAVIDPRPYQAQLDGAIAKKNQDLAQLNNAKVLLERDTDLYKKGALDHQSYDTQRFLVDQLDATVAADQASIDNAKTQLSYTRITASFDGRCGIRQIDEGNFVSSSSVLVVLTQLKPISIVFTLPQQNVLQVNQAIARDGTLKVSALDSTLAKVLEEGTLAVVDNQIDTTTGTVKLKATFPNDDLKLWPGQFVNSRLLVSVRKNGLVVPAPVVQRGPNGSFAYVINPEKKAEMRTIEVAQIEDGYALIDNGLQEGEQVVVDGQYKLQPNAPVQVMSPSSQPGPAQLTQGGPSASPNKRPADHGSPAEAEGAEKGKHRSREGSQRQTEGSVSPASASQG